MPLIFTKTSALSASKAAISSMISSGLRIGLAHVASRVKGVVPDLAGGCALLEEQHHRLDSRPQECAARTVEDGVQVATLQQEFPQTDRCIVGIGEEGVLDHHASPSTGPDYPDEVLEEEKGGFAGLAQPASFQRMSSIFLKACSNMGFPSAG
jgi:hypothetical protein